MDELMEIVGKALEQASREDRIGSWGKITDENVYGVETEGGDLFFVEIKPA